MSIRGARAGLIAGVAATVVALDQVSKAWALRHLKAGPRHVIGTLQLSLTFNSGIAFSAATGATVAVTAVAVVILAVLVAVAWRTRGLGSGAILGLVMGGAAGNLADRLLRDHGGAVIDFIDLRWWPVFNVADAAITVGIAAVVVRSFLGNGHARAPSAGATVGQ